AEVVSCLEDGLLEQVVDRFSAEGDAAPQGLVGAVFAPGLCEGFELAVGGLAAELDEMALDAFHLGEAERKLTGAAQVQQLVVTRSTDRHGNALKSIGLSGVEPVQIERAENGHLDGVIGKHALDEARQSGGGTVNAVTPDRSHVRDGVAQMFEQLEGA